MSWAVANNEPEWVAVFPLDDCPDLELSPIQEDPAVVRRWIETQRRHAQCWLCERGGCFQRVELLRNGCEFVLHGTILN